MSARLKPLILPQLVQERKKLDDVRCSVDAVEGTSIFLVDNASMSDITSPATPTFSHRSGLGHLRYSSSTSSLDLPLSLPSPSFSECPASPIATSGIVAAVPSTVSAVHAGNNAPKRPLPDVQEEDLLERVAEDGGEDAEDIVPSHRISDLYGCLCDEPCTHGREEASPVSYADVQNFDYDLGFVSDGEAAPNASSVRRHRAGGSVSGASDGTHDSAFSGLTLRFGSQIHALSRWRSGSSKRTYVNLAGAPASEPSLSRAPSSRSSSLSAGRPMVEAPLILTPALSFYGSTESIDHIPTTSTLDIELVEERHSLERDRAKATTPLLPPLFISSPQPPASPLPPSLQTSPLQPPKIASPAPGGDSVGLLANVADSSIPAMSLSSTAASATTPSLLPSPPLSRKFSVASFHMPFGSNAPTASALEPHDEWSNRLGHANYTIVPKPYYLGGNADAQALNLLREDWAQARVNYAKHLVRTGEHYGTTSNTYVLTEAKWAETEREWKSAHGAAIAHILSLGDEGEYANLGLFPLHHDVSSVVPQILDAEGKFPHLGDEDIVGPMDRVACMEREITSAGEKHGMSKFLRGLAGKVRMRK